jgi:hypothetical protein
MALPRVCFESFIYIQCVLDSLCLGSVPYNLGKYMMPRGIGFDEGQVFSSSGRLRNSVPLLDLT